MRITTVLAYILMSLSLAACTGVDIQPGEIDRFAAGNYRYYKWRTPPLPKEAQSSDPFYIIDPVVRREVDQDLQSKGYELDPQRAQFTVDYLYMSGMLQGERSEVASNISPYPRVMPNRQADQASVDNAIALGGVKQTNNLILQFYDRESNQEVWRTTLTSIVENANNIDTSLLDDNLKKFLERALRPLPPAPRQ